MRLFGFAQEGSLAVGKVFFGARYGRGLFGGFGAELADYALKFCISGAGFGIDFASDGVDTAGLVERLAGAADSIGGFVFCAGGLCCELNSFEVACHFDAFFLAF